MQTVPDIETLDRAGLCATWTRVLGSEPPAAISRPMMRRILAFELQAHAQGGLDRATRKAIARARNRPTRAAPRLKPGSRLLRDWNGESHVVDVTEDGFVWRGHRYRSLSAVAHAITGAHWSGPRFFGLTGGRHGKD